MAHDLREISPSPARQLINRTRSLELTEMPHGPQCCGQGGTFHISYPGLSQDIGRRLWHDFTKVNSPLVTTTCTGCLLQWQQGLRAAGITARVVHLAILLDEHL
ncbi:MAG: (Fe-S)-binding protein [Deltaproteobacteria bacterium]|nr:(Fe-S)-binding protein [Deltaproteobacteria bacterium]